MDRVTAMCRLPSRVAVECLLKKAVGQSLGFAGDETSLPIPISSSRTHALQPRGWCLQSTQPFVETKAFRAPPPTAPKLTGVGTAQTRVACRPPPVAPALSQPSFNPQPRLGNPLRPTRVLSLPQNPLSCNPCRPAAQPLIATALQDTVDILQVHLSCVGRKAT